MKAAVIGSGSWGTALALLLCANGHETALWSHDPRKAAQMKASRENPRLTGVRLPEALEITADPAWVAECTLVVLASPSFALRDISRKIAPYLRKDAVLAVATKGVEQGSLKRMSQVAAEETGCRVVALTGPSHAEEVARGIPTGCLAAGEDQTAAELVQGAFMSDTFRVYTSPDMVGAELGGALKNVIALCAGISDGLGYGDNTKAMLMTRGLTEIARLGSAMGASRETFTGLAGVGDLIVTCTSLHSRNRRAGILIGQGVSPEKAMEQVGAVVEGYYAACSAWELCGRLGVEMPIIGAAYAVLYEGQAPDKAVRELLTRPARPEPELAGWE